MVVVSLLAGVVAFVLFGAFLVWVTFRRIRKSPSVGFLSTTETAAVLASKHVRRLYLSNIPPAVCVETKFKYPMGLNIVVDAEVIDGNLYLSEPVFRRAIALRGRLYNQVNCVHPKGTDRILEEFGCRVGTTGLIQYGPVPFTPKALVDGVQYMAQASLSVYALPA